MRQDPFSIGREAEHVAGLFFRLLWHARQKLLYDHSRTLTEAKIKDFPGRTAHYLHLICKNVSWFVRAKGCQAFLLQVMVFSGSQWRNLDTFVGPVPLHWANTPNGDYEYLSTEIDPRKDKRLDIGFVLSGETSFHLYIPKAWTGVIRILPPGQYRILIRCGAANAVPRETKMWFEFSVPL